MFADKRTGIGDGNERAGAGKFAAVKDAEFVARLEKSLAGIGGNVQIKPQSLADLGELVVLEFAQQKIEPPDQEGKMPGFQDETWQVMKEHMQPDAPANNDNTIDTKINRMGCLPK
jgi:hypothetical protein